jgi:TetR/AcrR family transcriptional regulator
MGNKPKLEHESADRILAIAWELFQQKGYRGVTVDEICARCNLTKPTLYYHFRDKEDLFVTVLQRQLLLFRDVLQQPGGIEDRLKLMAIAVLENFQTPYTVLLHDREHIQKPENQRIVRDAFRGYMFNPLRSLMQSGLDSGALRGRNAEMLTLMFLGIINNFINRTAEAGLDPTSLAGELTNLFLEGVSKK